MDDLLFSIITRTLVAGVPLLLATVGEIITERSGILNLGVEGSMAGGAVAAFAVTAATGNPLLGTLAGMLFAMFLALIHGITSVVFQANQTVSGLAITMLGLGIAGMWGKPFIGQPGIAHVEPLRLPLLGDIPFLGRVLNGLDLYFYTAVALSLAAWFWLGRTKGGIRLRTCGENPRAAEALGIPVERIRLLATMVGGAFFGLAGAFLALSYSTSWNEAMTGGRGWIANALCIFALWNPARAFLGAFLFGGIFVLQYVLQPLGIPSNLLGTLPYLATLLVLMADGLRTDHRRLHAPAALGDSFVRGER
jgi:simple sugar transport system permease protein